MTLNLPKSPNPHAVDDVTEGREMANKAAHWLTELDAVLAQTKHRDDRGGRAAKNTSASR
jgi:hypothetical protein